MNHPSRMISIFMVVFGLAVFGAGCGDGSDDDDNNTPAETESNVSYEKAIRYTLASIDDNALDAADMDTLNRPSGYMNLRNRRAINMNFPCGSISAESNSAEFTFQQNEGCGDIGGTVRMSFETGNQTQWQMEYINLAVGDCLIDGKAVYTFDFDGNTLSGTYTCENLTVCGNTYDNTISFSVTNETEGISYSLATEEYEYEESVAVETDIDVTVDEGQIGTVNGTATVVLNGETYTCSANSLVIEWGCGLPVSGTMAVTGPDGNTATADFNGVSCENPETNYTLNGKSYPCDLQEVENLFRDEGGWCDFEKALLASTAIFPE